MSELRGSDRSTRVGLLSIGVNPDYPRPWPPGLLTRLVRAMEAVEALAIDDALQVLSELVGDVYVIARAELAEHRASSVPTPEELARWREIVERRLREGVQS
jgi:hypothetical protein